MDHELIRYVRKGGKYHVGVLCDKHPVLRSKKGITSVVDRSKFVPCLTDFTGKLRDVYTPTARREEAAKGQGQFVMTYQTADDRKIEALNRQLDSQLAEKRRIENLQRSLDEAKRLIEDQAHRTSAELSEVQTMKLL